MIRNVGVSGVSFARVPCAICCAEILRWDEEAEQWQQVGEMLHGRQAHAVLVIPDTLRNLYCNN